MTPTPEKLWGPKEQTLLERTEKNWQGIQESNHRLDAKLVAIGVGSLAALSLLAAVLGLREEPAPIRTWVVVVLGLSSVVAQVASLIGRIHTLTQYPTSIEFGPLVDQYLPKTERELFLQMLSDLTNAAQSALTLNRRKAVCMDLGSVALANQALFTAYVLVAQVARI